MKFWALIPSRYGSTRFPAKPLALIKGVPLLQRVVEQVQRAQGLEGIIVATDHSEIQALCQKIKVKVVMTDSELASGTDRIFQAALKSQEKIQDEDVVINIQGDEPLMPPQWIENICSYFREHPEAQILTLAHPLAQEELENLNSVKVVLDSQDKALYFSRFPIPHSRVREGNPICLKHIGIYAYRFKSLEKFCKTPVCDLEKAESLEQLRALYVGLSIHVMKVKEAIQGVDVPEDIKKVEALLG